MLQRILIFLLFIQSIAAQIPNTAQPAPDSLCSWQKIRVGVNADETDPQNFKSLHYAINSDHCATLCMMNHSMFMPEPCTAYAFTYDVPWAGPKHNCFMYTSSIDSSSFVSTGPFDLYKRVCSVKSPINPTIPIKSSTTIPQTNPTNGECCGELIQMKTINSTDDDILSFTYDSSICRKIANISCSMLPTRTLEKGWVSSILVNKAHYISQNQYINNTYHLTSHATCKDGKWQIADPPLTVESLQCKLSDADSKVETKSCCGILSEKVAPNFYVNSNLYHSNLNNKLGINSSNGLLSFTYDSNSCRRKALITCSDPNKQYPIAGIVVNDVEYADYGTGPVHQIAWCIDGVWRSTVLSDLFIESLKCQLSPHINNDTLKLCSKPYLYFGIDYEELESLYIEELTTSQCTWKFNFQSRWFRNKEGKSWVSLN